MSTRCVCVCVTFQCTQSRAFESFLNTFTSCCFSEALKKQLSNASVKTMSTTGPLDASLKTMAANILNELNEGESPPSPSSLTHSLTHVSIMAGDLEFLINQTSAADLCNNAPVPYDPRMSISGSDSLDPSFVSVLSSVVKSVEGRRPRSTGPSSISKFTEMNGRPTVGSISEGSGSGSGDSVGFSLNSIGFVRESHTQSITHNPLNSPLNHSTLVIENYV